MRVKPRKNRSEKLISLAPNSSRKSATFCIITFYCDAPHLTTSRKKFRHTCVPFQTKYRGLCYQYYPPKFFIAMHHISRLLARNLVTRFVRPSFKLKTERSKLKGKVRFARDLIL